MNGFLAFNSEAELCRAEVVCLVVDFVIAVEAFVNCSTALMLHIGGLQRQWGLMLCRPGLPCLGRQLIVENVESAAWKDRKANWNWGLRSITTKTPLRSSWTMRKGAAAMDNPSVDLESTAPEVENLLVDKREAKRSSSLNAKINKASKWVVAGLEVAVVLWRRDEHILWFVVGSIVSGGLAKSLKYLINENRPPSAEGVKEDPGMPSSHAQGFAYLATYACLALLSWQGLNIWTSVSSFGILLSFIYLSWLRVSEGLHTIPQVLVGSTLGSAVAGLWLHLWNAHVGAAVDSSVSAKFFLHLSFVAACVTCYFISLKDWKLGQY